MNLLSFSPRTISDSNWKTLADFREIDHPKVYSILQNMMDNINHLLPIFEGKVSKETYSTSYLGEQGSYYEKIRIFMKAGNHEQKIELLYPQLLKKNYFVMNGSMYVPLLFLERAPIDIIPDEKKGNRILVSLLPTYNFSFNISKNEIQFRNKIINFNMFISALFNEPEDEEYLTHLVENGIMEPYEELEGDIDSIFKNLGFHDREFFTKNSLTLSNFIDDYILLDYFKNMFYDFYKVNNIKDIIKLVIEYHVKNSTINMSDIRNRRVVMTEYLISPIFEMYLRLLYGAIDKNEKQAFLPTMNNRVLLTTGFRGNMHGGQYFNIALPYTSPIINKISQDIYIVTDGRVPKSWTANHPSAIGKLCPISVSAQKMGSNLVFTNDTRINHYGRIEV